MAAVLKSGSHLPKKKIIKNKNKTSFVCFNDKPLKMIKKCFLFHIKSSFPSEDIYIFVPAVMVI